MRQLVLGALGALVLAPAASAHTDALPQIELAWPARGTITTPFGPTHPGIDIGILRSLAVRAADRGVVVRAGFPPGYEGYGRLVEVDVGEGWSNLYAHLAAARVRAGDQVEAGQLLGIAGCTGWCTGTHLHFELRRSGAAVDPMTLLG